MFQLVRARIAVRAIYGMRLIYPHKFNNYESIYFIYNTWFELLYLILLMEPYKRNKGELILKNANRIVLIADDEN